MSDQICRPTLLVILNGSHCFKPVDKTRTEIFSIYNGKDMHRGELDMESIECVIFGSKSVKSY